MMRFTNWYVITGAPCSGKTTSIRDLEQRGYRVVHEVARAYIENEIKKGKSMVRIKADKLAFERHILYKKAEIEASLPENLIIFFDRAVPDSIAYFKLEGLNSDEPLKISRNVRYKKIFLFERLSFARDDARSENDAQAASLECLIRNSYQTLGYDIVRVPLLSVKQRTEFILQHLQ
ncbi:MAG: ATP-binding protein [Deltaproteobacteria bacterium]|nr:ATP-binding protein [Deltaproteobacteria bacterium]MBW2201366.1 ATP-binding protein [Deltaproteobacteria bacterium]